MNKESFLCAILVLAFIGLSRQQDPCVNYSDLGDPKRSSAYELQQTDIALCDYYTVVADNWYRFECEETGGDTISELPPGQYVPLNRCGTTSPIWINGIGKHPNNGGRSSVNACVNLSGGCDTSGPIEIQHCPVPEGKDYYVYQLFRPGGCPTAYCAGDIAPCPPGYIYNPDITLCVDNNPPMDGLPTLSGPIVVRDDPSRPFFRFFCNVKYTPLPKDSSRFTVTFLFDGEEDTSEDANKHILPVLPVVTDSSMLSVPLDERYFRGRLGKWLSCKVKSFWNHAPGVLSPSLTSVDNYWVGVKPEDQGQVVITSNNPDAEIRLVPTVPVLCPDLPFYETCRFEITLDPRPGTMDQRCSYYIYPQHGPEFEGTQNDKVESMNVVTIAAVPSQYMEQSEAEKKFNEMIPWDLDKDDYYPVWRYYEPNALQVKVLKDAGRVCSSTGDPHITTFDGRYVHCYDLGDYILWKSNSGRLFEVQVQHWRWNNGNSQIGTNCGVAVREGNHVLGITMCQSVQDKGKYPLRFIKYLSASDGRKGVITEMSTNRYAIVMPSGAKVEAAVGNDHMNLYVYPIDEDRDNSWGMCGNYNGDPLDDDPLNGNHCQHYGLSPEQSFFATQPQCMPYSTPVSPPCDCLNGGAVGDQRITCNMQEVETQKTRVDECDDNLREDWEGDRVRRSVHSVSTEHDDDVLPDDQIFYTNPIRIADPLPEVPWPTPSGITEQMAEDECNEAFKRSPIFAQCEAMVEIDAMIINCKLDIMLADELSMSARYTGIYEDECVIETTASLNVTSTDPEEIQSQLLVVQELQQNICPNMCSGQGSCVNSTCRCDSGFTSSDCSLATNQAPDIMSVQNSGLCDKSARPCSTTRVIADNLNTVAVVKCLYIEQDTTQHATGQASTFEFDAMPVSSLEVVCPIPVTSVLPDEDSGQSTHFVTFELSISNNGEDFSEMVLFTTYDSGCVTCTSPGQCSDPTCGGGGGLPSGIIAGIVLGVTGIVATSMAVYFVKRKKATKAKKETASDGHITARAFDNQVGPTKDSDSLNLQENGNC